MNFLGIIATIIFFLNVAVCLFFFLKVLRIANRHYNWREDFFAIKVWDKFTDDEKRILKKNRRYMFLSFFVCVVFMLLLFFLGDILFPSK